MRSRWFFLIPQVGALLVAMTVLALQATAAEVAVRVVSNDVRPALRASRFDAAAFKVETSRNVALRVKVAR